MKTSIRISVIFSIFTFFVVWFFIISINVFSYINWQKWEQKELQIKTIKHINEDKQFLEEQLESLEFEISLLFFVTFLSYFLSKILFSKLILKDIYFISKELKNLDINKIKKINIDNKEDNEINIIIKSINNFLDIIKTNRDNLKNFNSQVAHEFKTPLMVISSELEFLNLSWKNKKSYKKIENQVEKLNNLLNNFLLLTKIENKTNIKKQKFNLFELVEENLENLEKIYLEKNIKIINNISKKTNIFTNKELIIKNILDNAFKYNKNSWEIKIKRKYR